LTLIQQGANMLIDTYAGGIHVDGVGDVSGPEGRYDMGGRGDTPQKILYGAWKLGRDPKYAWMLRHIYEIPDFVSHEDRKKINEDSGKLKRDPRFSLKSRALEGFGTAILEGNTGSDDFRMRNSLVMRTGYGAGHSHSDQLNIEYFSRGVVAVPEFGGRGGYGVPATTAAQSHWLATVDGRTGYAGWTSLVAHLPETPCAEGWWQERGAEVRRFVSLVDAGDGNAYIFDVIRAKGGKERTYYFHGNETEPVDVEGIKSSRTAPNLPTAGAGDDEIDSLIQEMKKDSSGKAQFTWNPSMFSHNLDATDKETKIPGDVYQAVWPMKKSMEERIQRRSMSFDFAAGEKPTLVPVQNTPRIFTRLMLFGAKGMKNKMFIASSDQVNYRIPCIQVTDERKPEDSSVFLSLVDCFSGKPVVQSARRVTVSGSDSAATALEVEIGKERLDTLVQSEMIDAVHAVKGKHPLSAAGRFAFLSMDGKQPRAGSLVNGTRLDAANGIGLRLEIPAYEATVAEVDYNRRLITLDRKIPASLVRGSCFIIGSEPFQVSDVSDGEKGTVLHFEKSALAVQAPLFTVHKNAAVGIH
jgi:hypothetical protein